MKDKTLESLGKLLTEDLPRDAIHIAVAPVVADAHMHPGQRIGFTVEPLVSTHAQELIGIVDPYLEGPVYKGQKFWMFLYPGSITSLAHHWTHPAFTQEAHVQKTVSDIIKNNTTVEPLKTFSVFTNSEVAASEKWLRDYLNDNHLPDFETMKEAIETGTSKSKDDRYYDSYVSIESDYILVQGGDAHGDIPDEFWTHWEVVLGKRLYNTAKYFSCSC